MNKDESVIIRMSPLFQMGNTGMMGGGMVQPNMGMMGNQVTFPSL